jgi:signal transduction histidine kinase
MSAGTTSMRLGPEPADLLSIEERGRYLLILRSFLAVVAVAVTVFERPTFEGAPVAVTIGAAISIALAALPLVVGRRSRTGAVAVLNASLLLDGLLFAAGITVTGLAGSPLRFLLLAHAVGVILIVSYRTGIKLVLWHSLLYLLVVEAERAGLLDARFSTDPAGSPAKVAVATIAGLWVLALGTAAFAALGERELRRQKVDLERLSAMVARIEAAPAADGIPQILLEDLSATFGFERGIVLASHVGEPTVMASIPDEGAGDVHVHRGVDALVERAWSERAVVAVRSIDPRTDPTIAALLPSSSNVLVVPMLGDRGRRVGTVVLERGGHDGGIRSWVVSMVAQATAHATLALENAWLSEERKERIDEIRRLQDELEAHNEDLERTVEERTEELRTVISDLEEIDRQRRRLLEHVVRATEEERQKIANDVHDDPVQKMIAVKMRLELLRKTHPGIEDVEHALEVVSGSITSLRHLLFDLRPPILDEEGLAPAIRSFLENAEPPFRWRVDDHTTSQPSTQTRLILYRIAQEALTNARKHSGAARVEVLLRDHEDGVEMEISDDGVGFLPQDAIVAAPGHMGLAAMRERAEMAGGRCELRSLPDAGTTLMVWLPSETAAPESEPAEPTLLRFGARSA